MAVNGADEENRRGHSFAVSGSGVSREMMDADSACNSFWELEGTGAGATGAEGALGTAQHAILQRCMPWQQHRCAAGELPGIATIGHAAIRNPSSNATANLVSFNVMPVSCSFTISEPYKTSHIELCDANFYFTLPPKALSDSDYGLEWTP
jgi:hypothetical protein